MGGVSTAPKVLSYLATLAPSTVVSRQQIMTATGLDDNQVQAVMYRVAKAPDAAFEVIQKGHIWRIKPAPAPVPAPEVNVFTGVVVERLGGHRIVRDSEGYLYSLKRIGLSED